MTTKDDQQISQILAQMSATPAVHPPLDSNPEDALPVPPPDPAPAPAPPPPPAPAVAVPPAAPATSRTTAAATKGTKGRGRARSDERLAMNQDEWEQSRKDNHKEVERKRREAITAGINALAALLPADWMVATPPPSVASSNTALPPPPIASTSGGGISVLPTPPPVASTSTSASTTTKPTTTPSQTTNANKGLILHRAVSYISELQLAQKRNIEKWTLEKLLSEQRVAELEKERDAWRDECWRLRGGGGGGGNGCERDRELERERSCARGR
ncbi:hypothetical protein JCM10908_000800 [Rhodotorula pacifica]|uniref:uncharacterized protein n=1 Tax=Rhodotorula pacifica TaxID=1495444 RepID=UPI003177320B